MYTITLLLSHLFIEKNQERVVLALGFLEGKLWFKHCLIAFLGLSQNTGIKFVDLMEKRIDQLCGYVCFYAF